MIEGKERADLDDAARTASLNGLLVSPVYLADMDDQASQTVNNALQDYMDKWEAEIKHDHRDINDQTLRQETAQADAFAQVFAMRKSLKRGGKN
ncbi:hypothetical protein FC50_GL000956 [Lacticaseibacillus pantheris DSM 15945 = JCM 12539 = NBRC 106106]|uniref:Uncharacterized protein n=1 Tax=Lacticaseibacillus pantheris DSM 15945 = JCM 12539 = NBRC 106106 TaxID=1423783 RepID=A0A0R1U608_9LACO|nr:hypothetical protein [Lacticaseibacillus pantheris]KRL86434.1 hypothetical protein FC50_GL000956 [Lacticaseibacillus pantheris DSM 15945 = JCM 12539 = NBRC 106106]